MPRPEDIKLPDRPKPVEQPKPAPVAPPKEVSPTLPILPAETKPEPKQMTREEFFAQNPLKPQPAPRTPPRPQNVKVDLGNVTRNLGAISVDSRIGDITTTIGTTTANEIQAYLARFREAVRLNLASHPFAGAALRVTVECDISANGHVSNIRVSRGSGDAVFDRKAVDAFKRIGIFQASPDGRGFRGISFELEQQ